MKLYSTKTILVKYVDIFALFVVACKNAPLQRWLQNLPPVQFRDSPSKTQVDGSLAKTLHFGLHLNFIFANLMSGL